MDILKATIIRIRLWEYYQMADWALCKYNAPTEDGVNYTYEAGFPDVQEDRFLKLEDSEYELYLPKMPGFRDFLLDEYKKLTQIIGAFVDKNRVIPADQMTNEVDYAAILTDADDFLSLLDKYLKGRESME